MYRQGYFRQRLNRSGWQEDYYIDNDFENLPLELLRSHSGEVLTVELHIRQRTVKRRSGRLGLDE